MPNPKPNTSGLVPFAAGDDPRRHKHGSLSQAMVAYKEALALRLDRALEIVDEALASNSAARRDAMAIEVMDRTIGKPKTIEVDNEAVVRAELAVIFARLRSKLSEDDYRHLVHAVAEETAP